MPYDATPLTTLTPFASIDLSAAERAARAELATARMELALCRPDRRKARKKRERKRKEAKKARAI